MAEIMVRFDDLRLIEQMPAVTTEPKRGHWKAIMMSEMTGWDLSLTGGYDEVAEYVCSCCKEAAILDENGKDFLPNFCPYCGARMDGGT